MRRELDTKDRRRIEGRGRAAYLPLLYATARLPRHSRPPARGRWRRGAGVPGSIALEQDRRQHRRYRRITARPPTGAPFEYLSWLRLFHRLLPMACAAPRGGAAPYASPGSDEPASRLHPSIFTASPKQRPSPSRPDLVFPPAGPRPFAAARRAARRGLAHLAAQLPSPRMAGKLGCSANILEAGGPAEWSSTHD